MDAFPGFTDKETFTPLPDSFFRRLLAEIEDAAELKVTLHALWLVANMEGTLHALTAGDFTGILPDPTPALEKAARRGTLLLVLSQGQLLVFLNSPRGRAAAAAVASGERQAVLSPATPPERPNIFKLYEENIGPLTPLIADRLRDTEKEYPDDWIAEALEIAVTKNKRNWKYVEAILNRWKEEGHAKKQDRSNAQSGGRRYSEGEFSEYINPD